MKGGKRGHDVTAGWSAASGPAAGLRERKERRTRATLLRASWEFFTAKKYEETTVDEMPTPSRSRSAPSPAPSRARRRPPSPRSGWRNSTPSTPLHAHPAQEGPFDALQALTASRLGPPRPDAHHGLAENRLL